MNYTQLKQAIQDTTEYTEATFVANLDLIIKRGEERIQRTVYLPAFRLTSTATLTASSKYFSTPSNFLFPYSMSVTDGTATYQLLFKEPDWITEAYPSSATTGRPIYYALFDHNTLMFGPTPDSGYPAQLTYNAQPESIVTATTTWLGDNAENALLYACLVEAGIFMRQDADLMQAYEMHYQEAIEQLVVLGAVRTRKDDYKSRDARQGVDA